MINHVPYLEHVVEFLAGDSAFGTDWLMSELEHKDLKLFKNLKTQFAKNIAITDRQHDLVCDILPKYANLLPMFDLDKVRNNVKLGIRSLDRSKTIDYIEIDYKSRTLTHEYKKPCIRIKFLYDTNLIAKISKLQHHLEYVKYDKRSKIHYFAYSEGALSIVLETFKDDDFEVSDDLKKIVNHAQTYNEVECVPCVNQRQVKNITDNCRNGLTSELGELNDRSALLYRDRSIKYNLKWFDVTLLQNTKPHYSSLSFDIATRKSICIRAADEIDLETVSKTLGELKRQQVLIILSSYNGLKELTLSYPNVRKNISDKIGFFCNPSNENQPIRRFVDDHDFESNIDKCDVVYILDIKAPLSVVNSKWKPTTIILPNNTTKVMGLSKTLMFFNTADLVWYYGSNINSSLKTALMGIYKNIEYVS